MNTLSVRPAFRRAAPTGLAWRAPQRLGSTRLTLFILAALAAGVVAAYQSEPRASWPIVVPLAAAALNLFAAIVSNGVFRWKLPLLMFHLCLLALVVLIACGRLTYLKGRLELTDGATFSGELSAVETGPWHAGRLRDVRFVNQGFRIDHAPGVRRGPTRNTISYRDDAGHPAQALIGDQTPLVVHGYRFYTSFNKGFAPTFAWQPRGARAAQIGSVHLPAYPLHEYRQARAWRLPLALRPKRGKRP